MDDPSRAAGMDGRMVTLRGSRSPDCPCVGRDGTANSWWPNQRVSTSRRGSRGKTIGSGYYTSECMLHTRGSEEKWRDRIVVIVSRTGQLVCTLSNSAATDVLSCAACSLASDSQGPVEAACACEECFSAFFGCGCYRTE
jgi:hypothetical protein